MITGVIIGDGFFGLFLKAILPILFINYLVKKMSSGNKLDNIYFMKVHSSLTGLTGIFCITIIGYAIIYLETPEGFYVKLKDMLVLIPVLWFLVSSNHHVIKLKHQSK